MSDLLAFAEDPGAYLVTDPDEERLVTDRYCVTFAPGEHFWSTSVCRVRLADDVVEAVDEVRALMAARGRREAVWAIGPSATPPGVADGLIAHGLVPEYRDGSAILVLDRPPTAPTPPDAAIRVRPVVTLEEHVAAIEVGIEGFGFDERDAADERRRAQDTFGVERAVGSTTRLVAWDGDGPIATARVDHAPIGAHLGGVATRPDERGRGAMTALVLAAWDVVAARGTPALATFGGHMSVAGFERLGFRSIGRVLHLIDRGA